MFHRKPGQISPKSHPAQQKLQQTSNTTAPQVKAAHPATLIQRAKAEPSSLSADEVLTLQSAIGNREVSRLLAGRSTTKVQAKLTIGQPGDKYEQEADRVASQVVEQIHAPASAQSTHGQSVQLQEEKKEELLNKPIRQRQEAITGGLASTDLASAINRARGSGQPLDAGLQRSMGQAMGADFSGVKVHTDSQSDQLNQSIQAKAFTTGQDVFFRQGAYDPGSREGQELIAHELTHVVQQNGSAVVQMVAWDTPSLSTETSQYTDPTKEEETKKRFEIMRWMAFMKYTESEQGREFGREDFFEDNDFIYQSDFVGQDSKQEYVRLAKWYKMQQSYRALTDDSTKEIFKRHHIIPQNQLEAFYNKLSPVQKDIVKSELKRNGDEKADGLQVLKSLRSNLFLGPAKRGDDPKNEKDLRKKEGELDEESKELDSISKLMEGEPENNPKIFKEIIQRLKELESKKKEIRIEPGDFRWKGTVGEGYAKGNWYKA
jgi:hypothetical protein